MKARIKNIISWAAIGLLVGGTAGQSLSAFVGVAGAHWGRFNNKRD